MTKKINSLIFGKDGADKDPSSLNSHMKGKKKGGWRCTEVIAFEQRLLKNTEMTETCREMNPTYTDALSQTEFTHLLQCIWKALVK